MIVNTPRSQSRGFLSGKNVYFVIFGLLVLGLCCTLGPRLFSGNSKDLGSVPGNGRIASRPSEGPDQETENSSDDYMPSASDYMPSASDFNASQDPKIDPPSFSGVQSNLSVDAGNGGIYDTPPASDFNDAGQTTLLSDQPINAEFGPNSGDSLLGVQQHNSNSGDSMVDALQHNPNSGTPQHDPNSDDSHSGGSLLGDLFQLQ
eukprot:212902_1